METIVQMPAVIDAQPADLPMLRVITYPTSDEVIAQLRVECTDLSADTSKGYEAVRVAIGNLRSLRVSVEERRKELKAAALDYGRKVDSEAKRLTEAIEAIETPLKDKKQAVDDEKARIKAAEEEAKLAALREEIRQNEERQAAERRAAEEQQAAQRKAAQEAEERRIADERAALEVERQKAAAELERIEAAHAALAAERARVEAEQQAARAAEEARQHAEREALALERKALDEARQKAAREAAFQRAEQEARERLERERIAAEEARVAEAERQAALAARLDALRPDVDKLVAFAAELRAVTPPAVASDEAREWLNDTLQAITMAADSLEARATESEESFS